MRQALTLHPDERCDAVARLDVDITRRAPGLLILDYRLTGVIADLILPTPTAPARSDNLWKHICFEAFIRPTADEAYCEVNLSPSGDWAVYRFDGYRTGMGAPPEALAPLTNLTVTNGHLELHAHLDLAGLGLPADAPWRIGIAAVIEETNGRITHWALTHPPGRADFHHADGFACEIAP
jgi:hypothetical protein